MSKISKHEMTHLATRPLPHELWRTLHADSFDEVRRLEVMCHIGLFTTGIKEWRDAIAGDAAAAIGIALRMAIPEEITYSVDARMTLLLCSALNDSAGAALVLSHILRQMPIEQILRSQLATSWLTRNLLLAHPDLRPAGRPRRQRSIAFQLLNGEKSAS